MDLSKSFLLPICLLMLLSIEKSSSAESNLPDETIVSNTNKTGSFKSSVRFLQDSPNTLEFDERRVIKTKNGSTIKLVCTFTDPNSIETSHHKLVLNENVLWIKDKTGVISINGEIRMNKNKYYNSFLFSSNRDVSYTLTIDDLQKEDSGRYTCQHFDLNLMKYFDIVVLVPPSKPVIKYTVNNGQYIEQKSKTYDQIDLIENDSVDLDCSPLIAGNPSSNIVWLKNGYMYSSLRQISLSNLTAENHSDNYTCLIYSEALEEPLRINVKLFLYFKPQAHISLSGTRTDRLKPDNASLIKLVEGGNETLICNSYGNPEVLGIEWYKDGKIFKKNSYMIHFENVSKEDTGSYQCRVQNHIGRGSHAVLVQVHYKPILKMPKSYTALENSNFNMTCVIDSVPGVFSARWFKNGKELFINKTTLNDQGLSASPDYQIKTNETVSILRIFKINSNDHKSEFKCTVNSTVNPTGSKVVILKSETSSKLSVLFKPVIDRTIDRIKFKHHTNVTLKCSSKLNPVGEFEWYFNGALIQASNGTTKHSLEHLVYDDSEYQQSLLLLTNTKANNSGQYKCLVRNKVGVAEHTISLEDSSIKQVPFDLSCKKKYHDNVLLAWKIDENDIADIVKFQVVMNENTQLIDTQLNQILIENLTEASGYNFRVRAIYLNGPSEWSKSLNVTTESLNATSEDLLMIKICSMSNNFNFKVGANESCENYFKNEMNILPYNMVNIFILIFVAIIFVLVLMLCCSLTCMYCKRLRVRKRLRTTKLFSDHMKKRQAQLNYLNNITTNPIGDFKENLQFRYPAWACEQPPINQQNNSSDDYQLSYFSSSKIVPIPEGNEDSSKDTQSLDSLKEEEMDSYQFNDNRFADDRRSTMMNHQYMFKKINPQFKIDNSKEMNNFNFS